MNKQYHSQIGIARVIDLTQDSLYKIRAEMISGGLQGQEVYVGHNGTPCVTTSDRILVRLEFPARNETSIPFSDYENDLVGYVLTRNVPDGFDTAWSSRTLLYGSWNPQNPEEVLLINQVARLNPGVVERSLHFASHQGAIVPFAFKRNMGYEVWVGKSPEQAVNDYLRKVGTQEHPGTPRLITLDDHVDFAANIEPVLESTGLMLIELQPQV